MKKNDKKKNDKKKKGIAGWIVLGVCSVVLIVVIVVVVINLMSRKNEEYRVIKIAEHQGEIILERDDEEINFGDKNSIRGMNLKSEDTMTTQEDASIVLLVDSDKHIYADENTCFSIVATGDEENGKIKINLESGTALCELENKLPAEASFELETPNATAAVRGTTFGVYYNAETNETKVEVLKGSVEVKTPTATQMVEVGEAFIITGDEGIIEQEIATTEPEEPVTNDEPEEGETIEEPEDTVTMTEFEDVFAIMESLTPAENAVKGHPIMDDSMPREYIVVYSGAAMMFGNGEGVFIFESGNGASSEDMEMISRELSDNFNEIYGNINMSGNSVKISYKQIPEFAMDIIKKFCVDSDDYMRSITFEAMGIDETQSSGEGSGVMDGIMKYIFDFKVVESTPYDFYDGLGLIE